MNETHPHSPDAASDFEQVWMESRTTPARVQELAGQLKVTPTALDAIGIGWIEGPALDELHAAFGGDGPRPTGCFCSPEYGEDASVIGLALRAPDGRKGSPRGGKRGVVVPETLETAPAPTLIVEGASDVAAALTMGLAAVGRPSNSSGANIVHGLLPKRAILIVGENDAKPDGAWPGRDGAIAVARRLAELRGEPVPWALPPDGAKDVREWLRHRTEAGLDLRDRVACRAAGMELLSALKAAAVTVEPAATKSSRMLRTTASGEARGKLVILPGAGTTITSAAISLGDLLADAARVFNRGGGVARVVYEPGNPPRAELLTPAALASEFEAVAVLGAATETGVRPATCSESTARLIAHSAEFVARLPRLDVLSPCPVLIERDGVLVEIVGYDRESGIYGGGTRTDDVPLADAVAMLTMTVADFLFATPGDKSRAIAALVTPALVFGGLLGGRAPIDLGEADQSQTGKGYRTKLMAALYGGGVTTVTQKRGGVGGLEESFASALVRGRAFISFDNVRGRIDSPALESFMTEDIFYARRPYADSVEIRADRHVVSVTSNRAEITPDLANRASCVRLRKQPEGYEFRKFPEGDILDRVRANQGRYLGAVFAVVRAWHGAGKPQTGESRHDFRRWARVMDWIVTNVFGAAPLLDGHTEAKARMTNPAMTWMRDVSLVVKSAERMGEWLRAHALLDLLVDAGAEVPGLREGDATTDDAARQRALQAIGRKLGACFRSGAVAVIDDLQVERREITDPATFNRTREYRFAPAFVPPIPKSAIDGSGTKDASKPDTGEPQDHAPAFVPPMRPPIIGSDPPIPKPIFSQRQPIPANGSATYAGSRDSDISVSMEKECDPIAGIGGIDGCEDGDGPPAGWSAEAWRTVCAADAAATSAKDIPGSEEL